MWASSPCCFSHSECRAICPISRPVGEHIKQACMMAAEMCAQIRVGSIYTEVCRVTMVARCIPSPTCALARLRQPSSASWRQDIRTLSTTLLPYFQSRAEHAAIKVTVTNGRYQLNADADHRQYPLRLVQATNHHHAHQSPFSAYHNMKTVYSLTCMYRV